MKKILALLLLPLFCYVSLCSQNIPVSLNGNYRTEAKDWGLGVQVMIPVCKNFMLAPHITYFFEKDYGVSKFKTLNYGVDIHYAFKIRNSQSFVSPFIGVEGMSSWGSGSSYYLSYYGGYGSYASSYSHYDISDFDVFGTLGLSGKWFVDKNIFINTQAKYLLYFDDFDGNHFVFTAGIGYAF
jgi:hypothetical protein